MAMLKKQVIKLKKKDLDKAIIRGLSRGAWQGKKAGTAREQVHISAKLKLPRHKERLENLD
jgi:hypothetical protein